MKRKLLIAMFILLSVIAKAQWHHTNGPGAGKVLSLATSGASICAGTDGGRVFVSLDSGANWTGGPIGNVTFDVTTLAVNGTTIYAGSRTGNGLFYSTNMGNTWSQDMTGYFTGHVYAIAFKDTNIFVSEPPYGIYRKSVSSSTWTQLITLPISQCEAIAVAGSTIYAGGAMDGIYSSGDDGANWTNISSDLPYSTGAPGILSIAVNGSDIFVQNVGYGVFLSTNNGASWNAVNTGITSPSLVTNIPMVVAGSDMFAVLGNLYSTANSGALWTATNIYTLTSHNIISMAVIGTKLFVGTDASGVYTSNNYGTTWTLSNNGLTAANIPSIAVNGSNAMAAASGVGANMFLSTDAGNNWTAVNSTFVGTYDGQDFNSVTANSSSFICAGATGIWRTLNNGSSWNALPTFCSNESPVIAQGAKVYAGSTGYGLYRSVNNGTSFSHITSGIPANCDVSTILPSGNYVYVVSDYNFYVSADSGLTFTAITSGLPPSLIRTLAVIGTTIFAGTNGDGVYSSIDNGTTWNPANGSLPSPCYVYAMLAQGINLYLSYSGGGNTAVSVSTNNGANWTTVSLGSPFPQSFAIADTNLIAGCSDGVWVRSLNNILATIPVWPGDANHDFVVNNNDLLPLGLYYSQTGPARASVSNAWLAYSAPSWSLFQSNGEDLKHVDCNGDGLIDMNDTLAINQNFSLVHAMAPHQNNELRLSSPDIYFVTTAGTYNPGDIVDIEVWAGKASLPVSNLYGLAFNISYTSSLVQPGSENITYPNSWLDSPGINTLKISKIDALASTAYCAITRINHTNANGYGKIADFKFQVRTNITSASTFHLSFSDYLANDSSGVPAYFTPLPDSILLAPITTNISQTACDEFTINSQTYLTSGMYYQHLTNYLGYDSTLVLNLTVNTADTSVYQSSHTIMANATSATYQWLDCSTGNTTIAGATNQTFSPTINGSYSVLVTQNGCSDTSSCYSFNNLNVEDRTSTNSFTISPNPFSSETTITFVEMQKNIVIKIMDMLGKEIKTINFTGKQLTIEKEELLPGIYFVKIISESKNSPNKKIIIQ